MTKDDALKEALYLIEAFGRGCDCNDYSMDISKTIDALKEVLVQPVVKDYLTVQKPLSDEEITKMANIWGNGYQPVIIDFARAIEKRILQGI